MHSGGGGARVHHMRLRTTTERCWESRGCSRGPSQCTAIHPPAAPPAARQPPGHRSSCAASVPRVCVCEVALSAKGSLMHGPFSMPAHCRRTWR